MLHLRLSDIQDACAKAVNICPSTDARVASYINRAVERLLYEGEWKGTTQTFRLCVNAQGCVTWPREIETPLAASVCTSPIPIRSSWFEFSENGFGQIDNDSNCLRALIDRGEACTFDDVIGTGKKLAVYNDLAESAGETITIQFHDSSGQFVRTLVGGSWINGEQLTIGTTQGSYVYTTREVYPGAIYSVAKTKTNGVIRLFEYDTTTTDLRPLAYYQPDEETPAYRRSLVPILNNDDCEQQSLIVAAKLRFIPVENPADLLVISHREAIRLACRAVFQEENELWQMAQANWAQALRCLGMQLKHHKSGEKVAVNVQSHRTWAGGGRVPQ